MNLLAISGSRADRGYLDPVVRRLGCDLLYGVVPPCFGADAAESIAGAMGTALHKYAIELAARRPALVLLCGDRWETVAAAHACTLPGIPIAHIGGGARTAGSYDDIFRDQITRAATLHFCFTEGEAARLAPLVTPDRGDEIHVTGSPALSDLPDPMPPPRTRREVVAVLRPCTAAPPSPRSNRGEGEQVREALAGRDVLWIGSCPDVGSGAYPEPPLRRDEYLRTLAHADLVVGNSSSIVLESGFFGTPAVLVSPRQNGRALPHNVHPFWGTVTDLREACERQIAHGRYPRDLTYGDGSGADRIAAVLREYVDGL